MSIRPDLTINWAVSPRIIEVAAPSVALTIQDLYDTIRSLGAEAIDEPEIIDGSGKEILGAGILVGLTIKLLNARVKFEDRSGPDWTVCSIGGGNLVAVDEAGEPMGPVEPSAYTQVQVIMSAAGTITITGSGVTEQDKVDIKNAVASELATAHGDSSWEGATPIQVWGHTDRRLSSRDIESEVPGEHLPSEEQVQALEPILNAIRQLVERGARGASFKA